MNTVIVLFLLLLCQTALAQSNIYALRFGGPPADYERIFLPKENPLRSSVPRGLDDLNLKDKSPDTNRINLVFADTSRERTNKFFTSCLTEVPLDRLSLQCPGDLLTQMQVSGLIRDTVAIPRGTWTNHVYRYDTGGRYIFALRDAKSQEYLVDLRPGGFALVFFPDGTYRCVVGPGYWFLYPPQASAPANGNLPAQSKTNGASAATGPPG